MDLSIRFDEQLDVLSAVERRRLLVSLFRESSEEDTIISVSDWVDDETASVIAMQHKHLPKLEESGFIRWDQENRRVTEGPEFGEIEPLLELLDENQDELADDWT